MRHPRGAHQRTQRVEVRRQRDQHAHVHPGRLGRDVSPRICDLAPVQEPAFSHRLRCSGIRHGDSSGPRPRSTRRKVTWRESRIEPLRGELPGILSVNDTHAHPAGELAVIVDAGPRRCCPAPTGSAPPTPQPTEGPYTQIRQGKRCRAMRAHQSDVALRPSAAHIRFSEAV